MTFNPSDVSNYGGNAGKLVNAHTEKADITTHFTYEGGQRRLSEYSKDSLSRDVLIEEPNQAEVLEYLNKVVLSHIDDKHSHNPLQYVRRRIEVQEESSTDEDNIEKILDQFDSQFERYLENALDDKLSNELLDDFISKSLNIFVEGEKYPYIYIDDAYNSLLREVTMDSVESFASEINLNKPELIEELQFSLGSMGPTIWRNQGRGKFLEDPPEIEGVRFIESLDITEKDLENEQNYAVTLTEIEDFLTQEGIIDNLKNFNLDVLVFEEDDNRYQIPYEFMGDGFKSIVGLLWEMKRQGERSDVILLEEPENHMHPGYIRTLVHFLTQIAKKEEAQFFITTHNIDFISEFFEIEGEEKDYLQENLQLIQVQKELAQVLNYDMAKQDLDDLHLDLRGL